MLKRLLSVIPAVLVAQECCLALPGTRALGVEWQRGLGGQGSESAASLCETRDGGIVVAGNREHGNGDFDVVLVKVTGAGEPVWETTMENPGVDLLLGVLEHSSVSLIAVGAFQPPERPSLPTIFGIDAEGKIAWSKPVDSSTAGTLYDLVETDDGHLVAVGSLGSPSLSLPKLLLVKTTAEGEVVWSKTPAGETVFEGRGIRRDEAGFLLAGRAAPTTSSYRAYIGVANADGNMTLELQGTYSGQFYNEATDVVRSGDGFVVAGNAITFFDGPPNPYLMAIDLRGRTTWKSTVGPASRGCHILGAVALASDGGFVAPACGHLERLSASGRKLGEVELPIEDGSAVVLQSHSGDWLVAGTCGVGENTDILIARVTGERPFLRGDANRDHAVDVSDAVYILRWLFQSASRPSCADALDANDDALVDLSDAVHLLGFRFLGTEVLPPPATGQDVDPTPDLLGCTAEESSS